MEQELKTKLDQEIACPRVSTQNSGRKVSKDDSINPANFFNFEATTTNNLYFHSILKIPESHSIRPDIGSFTKHIAQTQKPISRISDFSTKTAATATKASPPAPPLHPAEETNGLSQSVEVSNWEETQPKFKSISRMSFRPITKAIDAEMLIEASGSEFLEDFECSMEENGSSELMQPSEALNVAPLTFLSGMKPLMIRGDQNKAIVLRKFVDKLQNRNANFKIYTCDICNKNFNNHAALGGHKAKNHPHSSKSFIERKKTFELRKSERKKRDFLRNF
jgi:hypothetical protein